jgi:hypothetical protein
MAERTIRSSQVNGRETTFFYSGRPNSLTFYEEGRKLAELTHDDLGQLVRFHCTRGKDVLPELHDMCGFRADPVETALDLGLGEKQQLTYLNGVQLDYAQYKNGRLKSQVTRKGDQKISRSFHPNGQVDLDGTVTVDADGAEVHPLNQLIKKYDSSGQLIQEARWRDDVVVVEDNWYPDGNKKQEIRRTRIDKGDNRKEVVTITRKFSESGKLLSEERVVDVSR